MALFLLAHILQPAVIGECFTGTGYSSMFLAAGCPEAKVLSVDNYSEGSLTGKDAYSEVLRLQASVHLPNMELLYGSTGELNTELQKQPIDLYFSDGPYGNAPRLAPDCVIVRQDDTSGQVPGRTFRILGGSHLSVMSPDEETSEALKREMSKVFPVETLS
jgi:predicted O-methyltransferase YrrM